MRLIVLGLALSMLAACATEPKVSEDNLVKAADVNAKLGLGYMQKGRNEIALRKLNKSLEQNPDNAEAHQYLAILYSRLDRPEEAEAHFKEALEIMPDSSLSSKVASVRNNYAVFLCRQKRYPEANKYFELVTHDPLYQSRGRLFENMARCEQDKGDVHKAEHLYTKALKINPQLSKSLLGLAQINYDKGLYNQAQTYLNNFLKYSAHNPESLWIAVLIERRRGNADRVANYSIRLKSKYPDSKQTRLLKQLEMQVPQ